MPSEFATKIIDMLSPSIGEFMATRKVNAACELAKIDIEKIKDSQKKKVSEQLEVVCSSFGPEIAKSVRENVEAI